MSQRPEEKSYNCQKSQKCHIDNYQLKTSIQNWTMIPIKEVGTKIDQAQVVMKHKGPK